MSDPNVGPPPQPEVDQIPQASQLQQQLDTLNRAIQQLYAGMPVISMTVQQDMNAPITPGTMAGPVFVTMSPPISDPQVLQVLATALEAQADAVTAQLVDLGYAPPPARATRGAAR
jgi:dihydroorotate dehydrogenase